ncbi:hypothetical protein [Streptomyces gibsoniae]|uniref:Uncharacterized protein n=1 Tax=Streptomyces gibsoniae TaxID=3075529 RepID=A0ABU2U7Y0_9ACTN|nr:hypothetical protein [Streptomyces sp. DSM 41699]MDT0469327.1 hypothetical protein [Streptomyces sp. DSM 41699]
MLRDFLAGLSAHLEAERLALKTRSELLAGIGGAGLHMVDKIDSRPRHPRARDTADPLHAARAAGVSSLWRLVGN